MISWIWTFLLSPFLFCNAKLKSELPVCDDFLEEIDKIVPVLETKAYRTCAANAKFDFLTGLDSIDVATLAKICANKACYQVRDIINNSSLSDCIIQVENMSIYIKGDVNAVFDQCAKQGNTTKKEEAIQGNTTNTTTSDGNSTVENYITEANVNQTTNEGELSILNFTTKDTTMKTCDTNVEMRLANILQKGEEAQNCKAHTGFGEITPNMTVPRSVCEEQHCRAMIMDAVNIFPTSEDCKLAFGGGNYVVVSKFIKAVAEFCHLDQTKNSTTTVDTGSGISSPSKSTISDENGSFSTTNTTNDTAGNSTNTTNAANGDIRSPMVMMLTSLSALAFLM